MRKAVRTLTFTLLFFIVNIMYVSANEPSTPNDVYLVGQSEGIVFDSEDKIFLQVSNMLPGDKVAGEIIIENKNNSPFDLFLKVDNLIYSNENLLDRLNLKIQCNGVTSYEGPLVMENYFDENIKIGTFDASVKTVLSAEVELDGETTDNLYKNSDVHIDWVFIAVKDDMPVNPEDGKPLMPLPWTGQEGVRIYLLTSVILISLGVYFVKDNKNGKGNESKND